MPTIFRFIFVVLVLRRAVASRVDNLTPEQILDKALVGASGVSERVRGQIDSFYEYEYDGHNYDLHNGGNDMFDGVANKIYNSNGVYSDVLYDYSFSYANYRYGTRIGHPFFGQMWIINRNMEEHTYRMQLVGYPGAGADGIVSTSEGSFKVDQLSTVSYHVFQVHGTSSPTVCELYFMLENKRWLPNFSGNLTVLRFSNSSEHTYNMVMVEGRPKNIMLGYVLLSSSTGDAIPDDEIRKVLTAATTPMLMLSPSERNFTTAALDAMQSANVSMMEAVTDWHNYTYTMQEIDNGGKGMYLSGNKVFFSEDYAEPEKLYYDIMYRRENFDITGNPGLPFVSLMWITNTNAEQHSYQLSVQSTPGRNDDGKLRNSSGTAHAGDSHSVFSAFQMYGVNRHASICEVYFVVSNPNWASDTNFEFETEFSNSSRLFHNNASIYGTPKNVLFGYMLLSKENGDYLNDSEISGAMEQLVIGFDSVAYQQSTDFVQDAMQAAIHVSPNVTGEITGWYNYLYDEWFYAISYEKYNMYNPWGNKLIFAEDLDHMEYNRASYEVFYSFPDSWSKSVKGHPFVSLTWIDTTEYEWFALKVHSHIEEYDYDLYDIYGGSLVVNTTAVDYYVFQLHNRTTPSICEVYFVLSNHEDWNSEIDDSYNGFHPDTSSVQDNYIYIGGNIKRIFIGYMLLSKHAEGGHISEDEIRSALSLSVGAMTEAFHDSGVYRATVSWSLISAMLTFLWAFDFE